MKPKKILILVNHEVVIYNFRKELVERLLSDGHKVYISSPTGNKIERLKKMGATILPIKIKRHSKNPLSDLKLLLKYLKVIKKIKPNIVLIYTIKPNIYGGIACRLRKAKYIPTITGLGQSLNQGLKSIIPEILYRWSLKKASHVFFQNNENLNYMLNKRLLKENYTVVNGSGVNLEEYQYHDYPSDESINFLFVGRIMKAKGIEEFLAAAKNIKQKYLNTSFDVVGAMEEDYNFILNQYEKEGIITYHGYKENALDYYVKCHVLVLPSYHEGLSNVLLEASSIGRPSIASNIPGCQEIIIDTENGYLVNPKDEMDLTSKFISFYKLDYKEKIAMGSKAREIVVKDFDRSKIVDTYIKRTNHV